MATSSITWTPVGGSNSTGQTVQYKLASDSSWVAHSSVGPNVSAATITGLTDNLIYDFRVVNICSVGGTLPSPLDQAINITCPTINLTPTYNSLAYSYTHLGGSINSYLVELLNAGNTVVSSQTVSSPSSIVSGNFTGLASSSIYRTRITAYAIGSSETFNKVCLSSDATTSAPPTCSAPTSVSATLS